MIFRDKKWVTIVMSIVLFISTGKTPSSSSVKRLTSVPGVVIGLGVASASVDPRRGWFPFVATAYMLSSVTFNILVTGFIGFRLILANRALNKEMPNRNVKLYSRIATTIVESAVAPSIFGILAALFAVIPLSKQHDTIQGEIIMIIFGDTFLALYYGFAVSPCIFGLLTDTCILISSIP